MNKKGKKAHILVIRLSAMGDVAMTVPVLLALTTTYPNIKVTVLTKKAFLPIFSGIPNIAVFEADVKRRHKGLMGLWRLYRELKVLGIDVVADLHNVLRSRVLQKYFALDKTPFAQLNKGRAEKKALTRPKNKDFKRLKSTHQRYADVFTELGYPIQLSPSNLLERKKLSPKILEMIPNVGSAKWVGLAPFAAHSGKMYPFEKTKEVIHSLNNTNKYIIFLFGGGAQEVEQLEAVSKPFSNVYCMAGKLNLSEELSLISNLDVMLSMDSGNAHLAANYGIPVVTLWGVTHPYLGFAPFNQPIENTILSDRERYPLVPTSVYGNKVPKGYEDVMETISTKEILNKLHTILEN